MPHTNEWVIEIIVEGILKYPWLLILVKISFRCVTLNISRGIILSFLLHKALKVLLTIHD